MVIQEELSRVIEQLRVNVVQPDGGDLELVSLTDDGTVTIKLHGSCVGCSSSTTTLRNGIERYLRHKLPGITRVIAV